MIFSLSYKNDVNIFEPYHEEELNIMMLLDVSFKGGGACCQSITNYE